MSFKIAIDGPSASGKTEVSKKIAKKLGILCVDTGAIYRAITLFCLRNNIDIENEELVSASLKSILVELKENNTYLNGTDVSSEIRENKVSLCTSIVARQRNVRDFVTAIQRKIASKQDVVIQGRDVTSVVLLDADLKIYLNAMPEERAKRRQKELALNNKNIPFEKILEEINERDERDMTRAISPLIKTSDSIEIDTTYMSIDEVVEKIINLARERGF